MSLHLDPSDWSLVTPGGVPYKLQEGYPKGKIGKTLSMTAKIIIEENQLANFINEAYPTISSTGSGFIIEPGLACPGFPGTVINEISFEPFDQGKAWIPGKTHPSPPEINPNYCQFLELTVDYKGVEASPGSSSDLQSLLEVSTDCGVEFLQMAAKLKAKFVASSNHTNPQGAAVSAGDEESPYDLNIPTAKVVPQTEWSVEYPQIAWTLLPTLLTIVRPKLGSVNSTTMALLGNAPFETILFLGMNIRQTFQYSDSTGWKRFCQLGLKFSEKCVTSSMDPSMAAGETKGHNHFYRPETGTWDRLKINGYSVYGTSNLNLLWT